MAKVARGYGIRGAASPLPLGAHGAQRGHSIKEIATRLMQLSDRASENRERFAQTTAENAARAELAAAQKPQLKSSAAIIGSRWYG